MVDRDMLVTVADPSRLLRVADELRDRGLDVLGILHVAQAIYVRGDPCALEGMEGIEFRDQEVFKTR